jgi:hypothetical protein
MGISVPVGTEIDTIFENGKCNSKSLGLNSASFFYE